MGSSLKIKGNDKYGTVVYTNVSLHDHAFSSAYKCSYYKQYGPWTVILLPAHPASFVHNFSLGCKVFISASPRMQEYCRLVIKNSFLDS